MKKVPPPKLPSGKKSPAKSGSVDTVAVLIGRIEALAIELAETKKVLGLARAQVDLYMDRAIAAEAELEKNQLAAKSPANPPG